jgi:uncharacterized protein (TIGR02722 family)
MRLTLAAMLVCITVPVLLLGCSSKEVRYEDEDRIVLVDDSFNDADLKKMANKMADSIVKYLTKSNPAKKPVLVVLRVDNKTSEHVQLTALTDKIVTALMQDGRIDVVDGTSRDDMKALYEYDASGYVNPDTAKRPGQQVGADFLLRGEIVSDVHRGGDTKVIWYQLTMWLTDISRNLKVWQDQEEIKKIAEK